MYSKIKQDKMWKTSFMYVATCVLLASNLCVTSAENSVSANDDIDLIEGAFESTGICQNNNADVFNACDFSDNFNKFNITEGYYPIVMLSIFIDKPSPFFDEFLHKIEHLDYPKSRLLLSITTFVEYHRKQVDEFINRIGDQYNASFVFNEIMENKIHARYSSLLLYTRKLCDYYFYIESEAHLDNSLTLLILILQNKKIIAPMLKKPYESRSNFWGALSKEGFYVQPFDYMDIIYYNKKGIWKVSYVSSCYLIKGKFIADIHTKSSYNVENLDYSTKFCQALREEGLILYIDNQRKFGHLISSESFNITLKNPEIYQIFENIYDWKQRYIHQNFEKNFNPNKKPAEPCQDVYLFPVLSEQFCKELIEIVENFGKWSIGTANKTYRSNVTKNELGAIRHIFLEQVGLRQVWIRFLNLFVYPLRISPYIIATHKSNLGYDGKYARENFFVLKYDQFNPNSLLPHADAIPILMTSIALSSPGHDYKGGGRHFFRYNCTVTDMKIGWILMHPGRLTHYFEDVQVTNGTRYDMVSFIYS